MSDGLTLDAAALIAFERANSRVVRILRQVAAHGGQLEIPATVFAQVIRRPSRQARLMNLLKDGSARMRLLDREDAVGTGRLLADSGTSDIVDAHVVVCARRSGTPVLTSDIEDLRRLDASLVLIRI